MDEPDDAFETLFRRELGPISRTAFLIVGDWEVAREVVQDTFVQVLRHWEKVKEMESPGGWARRVAIALYYLEDRPVSEIATLLGCGEVTVRTHLARGRKALAARLGEEDTDEPR